MPTPRPLLFAPLPLRDVTLPNRIVLAPLCQYSSTDGHAGDWHLVHLGKFALGGFGVVMTEAAAIEPNGRINHGDLGIWADDFIAGLRRVTDFVRAQGSLSAIQLAHAGRKAAVQRPWHGHGPLNETDFARGERPWRIVGPMSEAVDPGHLVPAALTPAEIASMVSRFGDAAARADRAGFDICEIHGAHGYLLASFLSPTVNKRNDAYGGERNGRMRFVIEVATEVRARWPQSKPLFVRLSCEDGAPDSWMIEDTIALAQELKRIGVDVIDCSSGGLRGSATLANTLRGPGYQVHYASEIRRRTGIATMAVGLVLDGLQAEAIMRAGDADLVAIGRQAMYDPYWAHHAALQIAADPEFQKWNEQAGWWLRRRAKALAAIGLDGAGAAVPAAAGGEERAP